MGLVRSALLGRPLLALAIGLAALLLRLAVPAGYMPVSDHGRIALALCAPAGPASAPSHHEKGAPAADGACAFADLALPAIGGADPIQLAAAFLFIVAMGLFPAAALPPRSALRLRPPLRGPPRHA